MDKLLKSHFRYWTLLFILTIGVVLCIMQGFRFLRYAEAISFNQLSLFEFLFISILIPIYLSMIRSFIKREVNFPGETGVYGITVIICIAMSSWIDYDTWSNTQKKLLDAESRDVVEIGLLVQFLLALIVGGFAFWGHRFKQKSISCEG